MDLLSASLEEHHIRAFAVLGGEVESYKVIDAKGLVFDVSAIGKWLPVGHQISISIEDEQT